MIKEFSGEEEKLGNAEKFYRLLVKVPSFRVRIEGMIQVSTSGNVACLFTWCFVKFSLYILRSHCY